MVSKESKAFDMILMGLAQLHDGGAEDCSKFLDTIFGFLARKTHYYTTTSKGAAQKMILDQFQTYEADAINKAKAEKNRKDLKESNTRKKELIVDSEAARCSPPKIQKLATVEESVTHEQKEVHGKERSQNNIPANDSIPSSSKNTSNNLRDFPRSQMLSEIEIRRPLQVPGFPPRSEHVAVAVENVIYSFGGFNRGGHPSYSPDGPLDVFVLNVNESESKWGIFPTKNNELLNQRCRHSAVVYKDSVLIFGGRDGKTKKISNSVHSLNTKTLKWEQFNVTGNIPDARSHHTAVVVRKELIVLGGCELCFELRSLDLETFHWSKIEAKGFSPLRRCSYSVTVYYDNLFIFGGWMPDGWTREHKTNLLRYDVQLKKWTIPETKGTPPCSRKGHGAFLHDDLIFIFGGSPKPRAYTNDLFSYDPVSCEWEEIKPIGNPPSPRWNFGCVALGDRVFVFGGEKGYKEDSDDTFVLQMEYPMVWKPQSGKNSKSVTTTSTSFITSSPFHSFASQIGIGAAEIHAGEETQLIEGYFGNNANNTITKNQGPSEPVQPRNSGGNNERALRENTDTEMHGSSSDKSNEKICLEGASIKIYTGIMDKVKIESD